jgi:hypothetical protein
VKKGQVYALLINLLLGRGVMEKHHSEMTVADVKHEMLLWESRYLVRHKWQPVDIIGAFTEGYTWYDEKGEGPFSQQVAVDTQKERDRDPRRQEYFNLEVKYSKIDRDIQNKKNSNLPFSAEETQLKVIEAELTSITNRSRG